MSVLTNAEVLNRSELVEVVESNVLNLINYVYIRSQERFGKLSKPNRKLIKALFEGDFDDGYDVDETVVECISDYEIEPFNQLMEDMKDKDVAYMIGVAEGLLIMIQTFDVKINTRAYNLLRYLVTEVKENL